MTTRRFAEMVIAAAIMSLGTWLIGWWTVPVIAAGWAAVRRADRSLPLAAGITAAISWAALLYLPSSVGAVQHLAQVAGMAMATGPGPLLALTLAYPALLAVSAASLTRALLPPQKA